MARRIGNSYSQGGRGLTAVVMSLGILAFADGGFNSLAYAQSANDIANARSQAEEIARRRQQERQQQQDATLDRLVRAPDGSAQQSGPRGSSLTPTGPCFVMTDIVVENVTLFSPTKVAQTVGPFEGKCLQISDIDAVVKAVTYLYTSKGYITTRAYLPEQDLSDGVLKLVVVEGVLETIIIDDNPNKHKGIVLTAFPGMIGKPLNLRDIEQGLDQLNRLTGHDATMQIKAGSKPGASILAVSRNIKLPLGASFTIDNAGSESTGENQLTSQFFYSNLLGINDQLGLTYSQSGPHDPLSVTDEGKFSQSYSWSYSIPYGRHTLSYNGSYSLYESQIVGTVGTIDTNGDSHSHAVSLGSLLYRDQTSKLSSIFSVNFNDARNFVAGTLLQSSSLQTTTGEAKLSYSGRLGDAPYSVSLAYGFGLPWFDSIDSSFQTSPTGPEALFEKYSLSASVIKPLKLGNLQFNASSALQAQWSVDNLLPAQQISLGGLSTVRGFRTSVASGNIGAYLRNDLSVDLPTDQLAGFGRVFSKLQPFVALDFGYIKEQTKFGIPQTNVIGGAFGFRLIGKNISFEVTHGSIYDAPGNVNTDDHDYTFVSLRKSF